MGVRIGSADERALVFKDEDVIDLWARTKDAGTVCPESDDIFGLGEREIGKGLAVIGVVADDLGSSAGGLSFVEQITAVCVGGFKREAGKIVCEPVDATVIGVGSLETLVAWTEGAGRIVGGDGLGLWSVGIANPRATATMGSEEHPFPAKGVPALFPNRGMRGRGHNERKWQNAWTYRNRYCSKGKTKNPSNGRVLKAGLGLKGYLRRRKRTIPNKPRETALPLEITPKKRAYR